MEVEGNEETVSYYCGICTEIISGVDVSEHPCFESEETHLDSEIAAQEEGNEDDDRSTEEILISLVADRRPLWDHKMPLTGRTKTIRDKLWMEIKEELNNEWTLQLIQKKWKSLKDRYFRIHNDEQYIPSGSGAKANKITWKYFNMLKFLSDNSIPRKTISTLEKCTDVPIIEENKENHIPSTSNVSTKRKRNIDEEILDAIKATAVEVPAQAPINSTINPICLEISNLLQDMIPRDRVKLEIELLNLAFNRKFPRLEN